MSSLAEAFKEDASRQEKFREYLLREKQAEHKHRKQVPHARWYFPPMIEL